MLIVFGGLPGTGKTSVSRAVAARFGAMHLRIDVIEQAMRNAGIAEVGAAGYAVANALAEANLGLGQTVVADCVNPVSESRRGWADVAARASARLAEIELVCSDPIEHRRRVESRTADLVGLAIPTWEAVSRRAFEPWDGDHLRLDTAGRSPVELAAQCIAYVSERASAHDNRFE